MGFIKKPVTADSDRGKESNRSGIGVFIAKLIASGLGAGYFPIAQGTMGSLWIPAMYLLVPWGNVPITQIAGQFILLFVTLIIYALGVWAAGLCEETWGHDPGRVVIDEIAGMLVTILFIPLSITTVFAGFLLFRAFDIIKPQPVRYAERMSGGWGVMNDDILAGIYANLVLRVLLMLR